MRIWHEGELIPSTPGKLRERTEQLRQMMPPDALVALDALLEHGAEIYWADLGRGLTVIAEAGVNSAMMERCGWKYMGRVALVGSTAGSWMWQPPSPA